MTTELQWHKADPRDLPKIEEDGDSKDLIFVLKEDYVWYGTIYCVGYFDNSLRFFARGQCEYVEFNKVKAWAYLPEEIEELEELKDKEL